MSRRPQPALAHLSQTDEATLTTAPMATAATSTTTTTAGAGLMMNSSSESSVNPSLPSLGPSSSATLLNPNNTNSTSTTTTTTAGPSSSPTTNTVTTSSSTSSGTWTEPPWSGWIETTGDALLILEAARRGLIPRVTRRLVDSERKMITSGSVFVFDEDESGIKRWTDGFFWSPSRILGNFLLYRETDKRGSSHRSTGVRSGAAGSVGVDDLDDGEFGGGAAAAARGRGGRQETHSLSRPKHESAQQLGTDRQRERTLVGSLTNSYKFKPDGLMKKTFSLAIGGVSQHLISYYKVEDVENGRLRSPSSLPELASLDISPEYLDKMHFRNPPKVEIGIDGLPRYRGEADDVVDITSSPLGGMHHHHSHHSHHHPAPLALPVSESSSSNAQKRTLRYDPYPSTTGADAGTTMPGAAAGGGPKRVRKGKHTKSSSQSSSTKVESPTAAAAASTATDDNIAASSSGSSALIHANPYVPYSPVAAASYYYPHAPTAYMYPASTGYQYPVHQQQQHANSVSPSPPPAGGASGSPPASPPTNPYPPSAPVASSSAPTSNAGATSTAPASAAMNAGIGYYPYYASAYPSSAYSSSTSGPGIPPSSSWPSNNSNNNGYAYAAGPTTGPGMNPYMVAGYASHQHHPHHHTQQGHEEQRYQQHQRGYQAGSGRAVERV